MDYTVKQLADLAGISPRTLHYYDEIGLLKPTSVRENGYRCYGEAALLRLQQILFYKELDLGLQEIRSILDSPNFDVIAALKSHRDALQGRVKRMERLIQTVDQTILHLRGETEMSQPQYFAGFNEARQKQYEQEIQRRFGERAFEDTIDWKSYSPEKQAAILAEGEAIYRDLAANIDKGAASSEVQQIIARWHRHLRYFYEPSVERLRVLALLYNEHPDFLETFTRIDPRLPEFLKQAIETYCQNLEQP
ncbi:MAG: MerR family transcriptional regulator [Chloroflexi bacterium]|nr:MerR family transcriptional regulator [Chloroflexota bacterium]